MVAGASSERGVDKMIRVGIIGYGYWGPNLLRNLVKTQGCRVISVTDLNPAKLESRQASLPFPGVDPHHPVSYWKTPTSMRL